MSFLPFGGDIFRSYVPYSAGAVHRHARALRATNAPCSVFSVYAPSGPPTTSTVSGASGSTNVDMSRYADVSPLKEIENGAVLVSNLSPPRTDTLPPPITVTAAAIARAWTFMRY